MYHIFRLPIKSIVYEGYEKEVGYSLTQWSKYLPPGTESILVDQNRLLNRLGYNPLITNETQYSEIDLSPKEIVQIKQNCQKF